MKKLGLSVLLALVLAGCGSTGSGQGEYDVSQRLMASGNFKEAVAHLETALQQEPENIDYKNALATARLRAGEKLLTQAESLLPQANYPTLEQIEELVKEAKSYLTLDRIQPFENKVQSARDALIVEVDTQYMSGLEAVNEKNWTAAFFALNKVKSLYPNYERSGPLLSQVRSEGTRDYLTQAKQAYDLYNFEQALRVARSALVIDPKNPIAKQFVERINTNNTSQFFLTLAQESAAQLDWAKVILACSKVKGLEPGNLACGELEAKAISKQVELEVDEANALLKSGYIIRAIARFNRAKEILDNQTDDDVERLFNALKSYLSNKAERYKENEAYGVAWYLLQAMRDLDPSEPNLFDRIKVIEDQIIERVKKSIAVFDFKSPSYNQDAGVLIANNLIANLFHNASQDINILEREYLKNVLEELKLGEQGLTDTSAERLGRLFGINIAITGSVLIFKAEEASSTSSETVRYKIGEEIQDNIDYLNWRARNPNPTKKELAEAPTPKILVPKFAERQYSVTHTKKVGFIEISFRIVDISTGQNTSVETIERKKIVEDRSNEGVQDAGVAFDPLEMVTDTELLQLMTDEVVEELSLKVLQPLRNQETEYYNDGEELLLRRKEGLNALEQFVNAIFDERIKSVVNSPISRQSNEYIDSIMESYRFRD